MKLNALIGFTALTFFTFAGFIGVEYYRNITFAQQGLQQCVVTPATGKYEVIWTKECPANGSEENK